MEPPAEGEQPPQQPPWGRLLRLGAEEGEPQVLLRKPECTIGRRRGCDLSFPGNKLVSGDHCKIIVDGKSGQVSLEDTSTNGTVINKLKLVKKQTCPLETGDVIYVVYRRNEPEHNVAYLYESLREKQGATPDPFEPDKENAFHVTKDTSGAGRSDDPPVLPPAPASQACFEEPQPSTSTSELFPSASTSSMEPRAGQAPAPGSVPGGACVSPQGCGPPSASGELSSVPSAVPDREGAPFPPSEPQDQEESEPAKKRRRGDGEPDLHLHLLITDQCGDNPTALGGGRAMAVKPDKMEETLTCVICQDLLHDCVSLQPCMHTFCAACYSGWMERSTLCPTCRCPVERICKNHILNNLVEAYLLQHPDKSRSEDDVRSMAARNRITQDMLQPKVRRSFSDEDGSSEDLLELSDVDSESSDISQPYVVCRQCPDYRRQAAQPLPAEQGPPQASGDTPSTSVSVAAELNLGDRCLDGVLSNNHYESDILKNYLATRGLTWKNVLTESLVALQRGVFLLSDYRIAGNTVLCYCCGLRSFRELAYQYRQNIPASELPAAVTSRPDCYWGRNCRTQVKAHHAMKFNHICEQTRFKN
ncbi:E3 ubiquitin-protein ligase CHFR isoform X3 [Rousettus aegyptiacus]|uniref:E3 ubiquitin-protein ligase CHFR isoform X3 n=1 Tax=Rousettus aegyptiacus TaxID=9407 RepID=UPI00168D5877|nr:E3 ubiquitin-protein ligase CHFR isoform X3 [Rousettus aegyptiacus]